MENASNAIIMAGAILIFVVAITLGVIMYSRVLEANDMVLTNSEQYNKTAEGLSWENNIERTIPGSEVVNQILEMAKASNSSMYSDFHYTKITVPGYGPFTYDRLKNYYGIVVNDSFGKIIVESNISSRFSNDLASISKKKYLIQTNGLHFSTAGDGSSIVEIIYKEKENT